MRTFPEDFKPKRIEDHKKHLYDRKLQYLRQMIFEHVLVNEIEKDNAKQDLEKLSKEEKKVNKAQLLKERYASKRDGFNLKQPITGVGGTNLGEIEDSMIKTIITELEERGWKCELGVANTMLYILDPSDSIPQGTQSTLLI